MYTFLPFASFAKSAAALDSGRLYRQVFDCKRIILAQLDPQVGHQTHRSKTMWNGHTRSLCVFAIALIDEATSRGIAISPYERRWLQVALESYRKDAPRVPWWLGDSRLHSSHRAALKRRDPHYYRAFTERTDMLLWWPHVQDAKTSPCASVQRSPQLVLC